MGRLNAPFRLYFKPTIKAMKKYSLAAFTSLLFILNLSEQDILINAVVVILSILIIVKGSKIK